MLLNINTYLFRGRTYLNIAKITFLFRQSFITVTKCVIIHIISDNLQSFRKCIKISDKRAAIVELHHAGKTKSL